MVMQNNEYRNKMKWTLINRVKICWYVLIGNNPEGIKIIQHNAYLKGYQDANNNEINVVQDYLKNELTKENYE